MTNKVKDLIVYRAYNYKGVSILVKIDFLNKTATLVERDKGYGQDGFKPKKWLFADRTTEYFAGWEMILDAMKFAINEARKELEAVKEEEFNAFVDVMLELDKVVKKK